MRCPELHICHNDDNIKISTSKSSRTFTCRYNLSDFLLRDMPYPSQGKSFLLSPEPFKLTRSSHIFVFSSLGTQESDEKSSVQDFIIGTLSIISSSNN